MYCIKPTKTTNMSMTEMAKLMRERTLEENSVDEKIANAKEKAYLRESAEHFKQVNDRLLSNAAATNARQNKVLNLKKSLISECLFRVYKNSVPYPMSHTDENIGRNLINNFINEQGVANLMSKMNSSNSYLLAEFSRIINKNYKSILESDECEDCKTAQPFDVDEDDKKAFFDDLDGVDTDSASEIIKQRVTDAISDFIDTNTQEKIEYEEILRAAQDKIDAANSTELAESYSFLAKKQITNLRAKRKKNILNFMVESLCKKALTDDSLKRIYVNEAAFDMDKIVDNTELIYTMMEMVNTIGLVKMDEAYLNDFIKTL